MAVINKTPDKPNYDFTKTEDGHLPAGLIPEQLYLSGIGYRDFTQVVDTEIYPEYEFEFDMWNVTIFINGELFLEVEDDAITGSHAANLFQDCFEWEWFKDESWQRMVILDSHGDIFYWGEKDA